MHAVRGWALRFDDGPVNGSLLGPLLARLLLPLCQHLGHAIALRSRCVPHHLASRQLTLWLPPFQADTVLRWATPTAAAMASVWPAVMAPRGNPPTSARGRSVRPLDAVSMRSPRAASMLCQTVCAVGMRSATEATTAAPARPRPRRTTAPSAPTVRHGAVLQFAIAVSRDSKLPGCVCVRVARPERFDGAETVPAGHVWQRDSAGDRDLLGRLQHRVSEAASHHDTFLLSCVAA